MEQGDNSPFTTFCLPMNVKSTGALSRRQALLLSAGAAASLVAPTVLAQGPSAGYPERAVKIVVPFAARSEERRVGKECRL